MSIRLDQVLRATGHAAGLTGDDIRGMADEIEAATFATSEEVQEAAGILATFRSVQGDTFREALVLAQDLSAVFGQSLTGSVTQLGKALEDPVEGISALRRVGISFTDEQRELIETLVETGRTAEAQGVILETLAAQVGGAGTAESQGLAGAWNRTADAVGNFLEEIAKVSGAAAATRGALNLIAGGLEAVNAAMGEVAVGQELVTANQELQRLRAEQTRLQGPEAAPWEAGQGVEVEREIAAVEARIEALTKLRRAEQVAGQEAEAGARAARDQARHEQALERLGKLKDELEGLGTTEEKVAAVETRLSETITQLEALRTESGAGVVDEAIATAQEVARRQIEALERPAQEAAARAAEQTKETIRDLSQSIVQFGDARAEFVARHLGKLGEGATPEERAEAERLANQLYDLEEAARAAGRGGGAGASGQREMNAAMREGTALTRALMTGDGGVRGDARGGEPAARRRRDQPGDLFPGGGGGPGRACGSPSGGRRGGGRGAPPAPARVGRPARRRAGVAAGVRRGEPEDRRGDRGGHGARPSARPRTRSGTSCAPARSSSARS